jgi:hypothetical protein
LLTFIPIFIPAFLYRFAIKSTAWLWFPLIYIQRGVQTITDKPFIEKQELIKSQYSLWFNVFLRWYSFFFVAFAIISVLYPQWIMHKEYIPFSAFIGFIENYRPNLMQLLGFSSAVLNLTIFFWFIDPLYKHVKDEADLTRHETKFKWLITLLRASHVLFIIIMIFGFISFMFLKTDMPWHNMPDYFVTFMTRLLETPINLKFWS